MPKTERDLLVDYYIWSRRQRVFTDAQDCTSWEQEVDNLLRQLAERMTDVELAADIAEHKAEDDPDPKLWPRECQQAAQKEGWDIFDADGSADGRWQLQAITCPEDGSKPIFQTDEKAAAHVKDMAVKGSELHRRAINFLITVKSRDVKKFLLFSAVD